MIEEREWMIKQWWSKNGNNKLICSLFSLLSKWNAVKGLALFDIIEIEGNT